MNAMLIRKMESILSSVEQSTDVVAAHDMWAVEAWGLNKSRISRMELYATRLHQPLFSPVMWAKPRVGAITLMESDGDVVPIRRHSEAFEASVPEFFRDMDPAWEWWLVTDSFETAWYLQECHSLVERFTRAWHRVVPGPLPETIHRAPRVRAEDVKPLVPVIAIPRIKEWQENKGDYGPPYTPVYETWGEYLTRKGGDSTPCD